MLSVLHIENIAVIESADILFGSGFNALTGETGAGKSTLVNLVGRFFEPTGGRLLIDGVEYRERSLLWLHSQIGSGQRNLFWGEGFALAGGKRTGDR